MSSIRQSAGNCLIEVFTDGWPLRFTVRIVQPNGDTVEARASAHDLYDLRYCMDRVMAQALTEPPVK